MQCTIFDQSKVTMGWTGGKKKKMNAASEKKKEHSYVALYYLRVRFEVFKAVTVKITGSQNETSCNLVERYRFFRKHAQPPYSMQKISIKLHDIHPRRQYIRSVSSL